MNKSFLTTLQSLTAKAQKLKLQLAIKPTAKRGRPSSRGLDTGFLILPLVLTVVVTAGCQNGAGGGKTSAGPSVSGSPSPSSSVASSPSPSSQPTQPVSPGTAGSASPSPAASSAPSPGNNGAVQVVANPDSVTVMVNKQFGLPERFEPNDLVYPNVPFTFKEMIEKRKMRKEAAAALEQLFAGAKKDGIYLAGVSAYRSYATQKSIYSNYVKQDGEEKARMYSAEPGHSEHETGLAIDVSGSDGKCAAQDCFGATKEAKWLAEHAPDYGFVIRYPKGKEAITGYQYEPWHIRYVGAKLAKELADKGLTLEEYFKAAPVAKQ